jgi:hypothetical protein
VRVPVIAGLLIANSGLYLAAFRILTPRDIATRPLLPAAITGAVAFPFLTTIGTGLIVHQLKHSTATYGALASVIGVVAYLLILAKTSMYAAELNPVLDRRLWPRALPTCDPTDADNQVLHDLAHEERRRKDQRVGVGFGDRSIQESQLDVSNDADDSTDQTSTARRLLGGPGPESGRGLSFEARACRKAGPQVDVAGLGSR